LGRPLALLLESARWFTHAVMETYRRAFDQLFAQMTSQAGGTTVEFWDFWSAMRPMLFDQKLTLINQIAVDFQRRWAEVLMLPEGADRVERSSADLETRVAAAFPAPRAGWLLARYHNPDVMIAAPSVEAIRRGEYIGVMGELHIAVNALSVPLFMEQHEAPDELLCAIDQDIPELRLVPLVPKYWPTLTGRLMLSLANPKDYRLELAPGPCDVPPDRLVPVSEVVVERAPDGRLVANSRNRALSFDLLESLSAAIQGEVTSRFKMLAGDAHTPRVQIDRLVVARQTWRFRAADLWFAFESEGATRFHEARRWAGAYELPRHVFVKTTAEVKPFYVDLTSPVYVDGLSRAARRCVERGMGEEWVSVSEMLPGPDECWLRDADGHSYTSELRLIAVNLDGLPV
jgi:lantibiotic biosynthesis dehydratase-like protein